MIRYGEVCQGRIGSASSADACASVSITLVRTTRWWWWWCRIVVQKIVINVTYKHDASIYYINRERWTAPLLSSQRWTATLLSAQRWIYQHHDRPHLFYHRSDGPHLLFYQRSDGPHLFYQRSDGPHLLDFITARAHSKSLCRWTDLSLIVWLQPSGPIVKEVIASISATLLYYWIKC